MDFLVALLVEIWLIESVKRLHRICRRLELLHLLIWGRCCLHWVIKSLSSVKKVNVCLHGLVWLLIATCSSRYLHRVHIN